MPEIVDLISEDEELEKIEEKRDCNINDDIFFSWGQNIGEKGCDITDISLVPGTLVNTPFGIGSIPLPFDNLNSEKPRSKRLLEKNRPIYSSIPVQLSFGMGYLNRNSVYKFPDIEILPFLSTMDIGRLKSRMTINDNVINYIFKKYELKFPHIGFANSQFFLVLQRILHDKSLSIDRKREKLNKIFMKYDQKEHVLIPIFADVS